MGLLVLQSMAGTERIVHALCLEVVVGGVQWRWWLDECILLPGDLFLGVSPGYIALQRSECPTLCADRAAVLSGG